MLVDSTMEDTLKKKTFQRKNLCHVQKRKPKRVLLRSDQEKTDDNTILKSRQFKLKLKIKIQKNPFADTFE